VWAGFWLCKIAHASYEAALELSCGHFVDDRRFPEIVDVVRRKVSG
jgi:hypothetical protein